MLQLRKQFRKSQKHQIISTARVRDLIQGSSKVNRNKRNRVNGKKRRAQPRKFRRKTNKQKKNHANRKSGRVLLIEIPTHVTLSYSAMYCFTTQLVGKEGYNV